VQADLRPPLALEAVGRTPYAPAALAGRVVLVHFFATWCFPCLQEVPAVRALHERYGPRGLSVVGVGLDLDGRRTLAPFADSYALPYPVLVASDALREGQTPYGRIAELPSTVVLDRQGRPLAAWSGLAPPAKVAQLVEAALAADGSR
jgi:thiol-disulfide isomerase/thioredoxin